MANDQQPTDADATGFPTQDEIYAMDPDMAKETLAKMTAAHAAAPSPGAELTASAELAPPTDADGKPITKPPETIFLLPEERDARNTASAKDFLETLNFPARGTPVGDDLWNMIEGRSPVSAKLQKAAEQKLAAMVADPEWRRKLLAGDQQTQREFHLATGIITAGKIQRPQDQSQW